MVRGLGHGPIHANEYQTFREAQASGSLLGGFVNYADRDSEDYPEHFIITTHRLPWSGINRQHYRLYAVKSQEDGKLRPNDKIEWIGTLIWDLYGGSGGPSKTAQISYAEIYSDQYRGRGLGRTLYVASINDLIDRQRVPVSDVYRSEYAEHVWASLIEANPGAIEVQPRIVPESEEMEYELDDESQIRSRKQYYEVTGYVQRHPVHVRKHRRRSPR